MTRNRFPRTAAACLAFAFAVPSAFAGEDAAGDPRRFDLTPKNLSPRDQAPPELSTALHRAQMDLTPVDSRGETGGEVPTPLIPVKTEFLPGDGVHTYRVADARDTVEYVFEPAKGFPAGLAIRKNGRPIDAKGDVVRESFTHERAARGGSGGQAEDETVHADRVAAARQAGLKPNQNEFAAQLVEQDARDGRVRAVYRYAAKDDPERAFVLTVALRLERASLLAELSVDVPALSRYNWRLAGGNQVFYEYYVGQMPRHYPKDNLFVGLFVLRDASDAGQIARDGVVYPAFTDGTRLPLRETFCLTASRYPESLFPNSSFPASPFRKEMQSRVIADFWEGSFAEHRERLETLAGYGVDNLLVTAHSWQNLGFDRSNPNMLPANEGSGGDAGLAALSRAVRGMGHRLSVHENYYDVVPGMPDYREDWLARNSDGSPIYRALRAMRFVKPVRHMDYVRRFSPEVKRRYGLDSTFHDVMPHTNKVDYEAGYPEAGRLRQVVDREVEYFTYARELFNGPVITELLDGRFAGAYDTATNAYMNNQADRRPLSAYEWLKIRPKTLHHGAGYPERWSAYGHRPGWEWRMLTPRQTDQHRAMALAFGRTGLISRQMLNSRHIPEILREYHLGRAVQEAIGDGRAKTVNYFVEYKGWRGWIDAAGAAGIKQFGRLRVAFDNGAELLVNYDEAPWELAGLTLPGWGFFCRGPGGIAYTALRDGQVASFAQWEGRVFADARSFAWTPPAGPAPLNPKLGAWKDLGGGKFELAIDWTPGRALEHDFNAFWEFKAADTPSSRPVFLSSHPIPGPATSAWEVGKSYSDGPHRLEAPNQTADYDLILGLTHPQAKAGRPFVYRQLSKVRVARLEVRAGENGAPTTLRFLPADIELPPGLDPEEHKADMNLGRKPLAFGGLVSDGAVVIRKAGNGAEIVPVPMGAPVKLVLPSDPGNVRVTGLDGKTVETTAAKGDKGFALDLPEGTRGASISRWP